MLEVIRQLLLVIQTVAAYPVADALPTITVVADTELQQMACGRPCWVKAFYDPDKGIFLSKSIDYEKDSYGQSILLHELVHYVQKTSGRYESAADPCERRNSEEMEAYAIQNRFLESRNDPRRIPMRQISMKCE